MWRVLHDLRAVQLSNSYDRLVWSLVTCNYVSWYAIAKVPCSLLVCSLVAYNRLDLMTVVKRQWKHQSQFSITSYAVYDCN